MNKDIKEKENILKVARGNFFIYLGVFIVSILLILVFSLIEGTSQTKLQAFSNICISVAEAE